MFLYRRPKHLNLLVWFVPLVIKILFISPLGHTTSKPLQASSMEYNAVEMNAEDVAMRRLLVKEILMEDFNSTPSLKDSRKRKMSKDSTDTESVMESDDCACHSLSSLWRFVGTCARYKDGHCMRLLRCTLRRKL